jgi:hypothetical protein
MPCFGIFRKALVPASTCGGNIETQFHFLSEGPLRGKRHWLNRGKAFSRDTVAFVQDASQVEISAARLSLENLLIPSEKACKIHFEDDHTDQRGTRHGNQNRHD